MRLAFLVLLLFASSASAGPILQVVQIAAPFIPGVGQAISIALMVFSFAYSIVQSSSAKKAARQAAAAQAAQAEAQRQAYNASLQDRTITHVSSDAPAVFIYGRSRVGSLVASMFTSGTRDEFRWLVCIHAAHECDGAEEMYINGTALGLGTLDGSGNVTTGKYANQVQVHVHLGGATDPVDPTLNAAFPSQWPASSVLRGYTYTVLRLDLNQSEFQSGLPDIQILLRGKKLYDPRSATTYWIQNPALAVMDYLTSEICNVPYSDLPEADYITAANVCDETESVGARYTCNGTVTADQDQVHVLEMLTQSMAGGLVSTTWSIYAGKYIAPVLALNQSDVVGKLAVTPGISDADIYNGVRGQAITADNLYVATDFEPYQNAAYVAADNGKEKWANINFPFTDSKQRIWNLARILTEDQRKGFTIKADLSYKAWRLKVGQRVTFDSTFLGETGVVYRVVDKSYSPITAVELTLKLDDVTIWDFADAVTPDSTPSNNLPDPHAIAAPGSLAVTEALYETTGSAGVKSKAIATWVDPPNVYLLDVTLEYKLHASSIWTVLSNLAGELREILDIAPAVYDFRIKAKNRFYDVSDYSSILTQELFGLNAPPSDPTSFTVIAVNGHALASFDLSPDLDVRQGGRMVPRWTPLTSGVVWENGVDIPNVTIPGDSTQAILPMLTGTYMLKSQDSSGNWSVNAAKWNLTTGNLLVLTNSSTLTEQTTFSGTKSGTVAVSGALQLDAATLVDSMLDLIDTWSLIDSIGGITPSGIYDASTVIDFGSVATRRFTVHIQALAFDTGDMIDSRGLIDSWSDVDGMSVNDATVANFISTSDDGVTYSPYFPIMSADLTCRYVKAQLQFSTAAPTHNIAVSEYSIKAEW